MNSGDVTPGEMEPVTEPKENGQFKLPPRLPSLDGWRAFSICMVLGEHSIYTYDCPPAPGKFLETYFDGNLGVRFFFVISGFLITYLLLKEHADTGKISLRNFYTRRALRILPVYFTYLAVVFVLQLLTPYRQSGITWFGNLTFTTNFLPMNSTTGHLWSLAVEEQFYLLWPPILCFAQSQKPRRILLLLGVPIIVAPLCRWISYAKLEPKIWKPFFQGYATWNQLDSLAIGCMAAVLFIQHREKILSLLTRFSRTSLLIGVAFVVLPEVCLKSFIAVYVNEGFSAILTPTFQGIGFGILILQSILLPRHFRELNWKVITQIGVLSYSIYIWQMLFSYQPSRFGLSAPWFMSVRYWWLAVLVTAICSYYLLEKPIMGLRRRFRPSSAPNKAVKIAS